MASMIKDYLSPQWWAIADCVDAYESDCGSGFPDLRSFVERLAPADRPAGLAELAKIELERRWRLGQRKKVEDYLRDYPELNDPSVSLDDLVAQEYLVRSRHGDPPTTDELHNRFPTLDAAKLIPAGQGIVATIALGNPDIDTKRSDSAPMQEPVARTIEFDSQKGASTPGSTAGVSSAPTAGGAAPASAAPASVAQITGSIGRYTIRQQLGAGSFGVVLRCSDDDLKRDVAIKLPHRQGAPSAERIKEFLHEAQSAARLRHPGIVTVLDTGQTADGRVYIVYEFIRGATLQSRLEQANYSLEDVVRWVAGSAEALHHAHKNGIVHRDIKPANILLDEESHPHVADFGLAKMDDQFFKNDAGRVLGTAAYMSPEQAAGQSHWASPQTDIYSLGVMLYQMLTKRLPFGGRTLSEMLEQVKQRVPSPPRTIDDKIPKPLEDVCLKAMAKNPADRYSTAADMASDLRRAIGGAPPASRSRWIIGGLGVAAAAALIVYLIIMANSRRDSERPSILGLQGVTSSTTARSGATIGDSLLDFPPATPKVEIDYQAATEKGGYHVLGKRDPSGPNVVIHSGDKLQFHVTVDVPRYLYIYWYDADGKPQRLWPEDVKRQAPVKKIDYPANNDDWQTLNEDLGSEFVLVAARDEPLDAVALAEFERHLPYSKNDVQVDAIFPIGSKELVSRGLGQIVNARKNPLGPEFEKKLSDTFVSYYGLVVPHRP